MINETNPLSELPPSLRLAVEQIIAEPISASDARRALAPLHRMEEPVVARRTITPRRAVLLSTLAASLLVAVWIFQPGSRSAWAQVVDAVAARPWLYGSGKTSDGQTTEFWYSGPEQLMADKTGGVLTIHDDRNRVTETYNPQGRQPAAIERRAVGPVNRSDLALFQALLDGKIEQFLAAPGKELVEQSRRRITVADKPRDEFRFVISEGGAGRSISTVLVDPQTKLPTRWEMESGPLADGRKFRVWCDLSYPSSGPETIYALGAPRSAPIDDQVPRDDLKRIIEGLALGRTRFDTYRGVAVIGSPTPVPDGGGPVTCYQLWRKGLKWRIEQCQIHGDDRLPAGADASAWWKARVGKSRLVLKYLSNGTRYYYPNPREPKFAPFPNDARPIPEPADPWRLFYTPELPEIVGHLNLRGESSAHDAMSLITKPDGGPAGCVLVETLRRDNEERTIVGCRQWIDPSRGYLVMLDEKLSGTRANHQVTGTAEIVDMAQTPAGHWYPTRMRVSGGSGSPDSGKTSDCFNNYYLDFDAEVPDKLFEIPD